MVLRRRDGAVERVEERGVKRAEGEFVDDVGEIERCGEKNRGVSGGRELINMNKRVMESAVNRQVSQLSINVWDSREIKKRVSISKWGEDKSDIPL